jgi:ribonuclease Z
MIHRAMLIAGVLIAGIGTSSPGQAESVTQVVMLGTGTPSPDFRRAGSGVAIIHMGEAYLFDVGSGVVRRAIEAQQRLRIAALQPRKICCLFLTHLHSDHLHDYPELAAKRWWHRDARLRAWGPKGIRALTQGMNAMLAVEAGVRVAGAPKDAIKLRDGYRADATEIAEGVVFRKDDLSIEAFRVHHGEIKPAYGYKITTANRSIVISGDTTYSEKLIEKAKGVDVLIHEVISAKALSGLPVSSREYHGKSHTTTAQLANIANKARPKLLVLYHVISMGEPEQRALNEVRAGYEGKVVLSRDLDVF